MHFTRLSFLICLTLLLSIVACKEDDSTTSNADSFDRVAMLTNWANNIIIPGYTNYTQKLADLNTATTTFTTAPNENNFDELRNKWLEAYKAWQPVSMFEIGKAETISLRNYTNIYPTDTQQILDNITEGTYNLELPSNYDVQGFPALDYLLYGLAQDKNEIITQLAQPAYAQYLTDLVARLNELSNEVLNDWTNGYKEVYINNQGSSASASVDKTVNDFIFYYEKFLRAGKIGIPAGVFSGSPMSQHVEAPYSAQYSAELFHIALDAVQDFFNDEESLSAYLDYLNTIKDGADLTMLINGQIDLARQTANEMTPDYQAQVDYDYVKMLQTYDELQKVVVLFKVDMVQAMSISIDYVDADGD